MKTILLISRCPPYPIHLGDRLIIWHLARELSQRGYTIDLLALYNQEDNPDTISEYQPFFRHIELYREIERSGFDYLRRLMRPSARFPQTAQWSFTPDMWVAIEAYLQRYDYDVVQCFGGVSVYEFQSLFSHKPTVITPYESYTLYLERVIQQGGWGARLSLPIVRGFERWMFTPYDRTVVIAQPDKDSLLAIQPQLNIDVISNGIDLNAFQLQDTPRDPHTLLFVGNYEYPPNLDAVKLLVEQILPRVRQQIPDAILKLVGNKPPDWMRDLANDHIEVTGRVPDVKPYLAQGTVFVCPLRIGAGLKNKVLEALAMGIPVVATPLSVDGIRVIHRESAWITDVDRIADGVIQVMRDSSLQQTLSKNGRVLIEAEYSWAHTASQYEALYDEIQK
jgi:polysaccharide biosynthesis protein PslH